MTEELQQDNSRKWPVRSFRGSQAPAGTGKEGAGRGPRGDAKGVDDFGNPRTFTGTEEISFRS